MPLRLRSSLPHGTALLLALGATHSAFPRTSLAASRLRLRPSLPRRKSTPPRPSLPCRTPTWPPNPFFISMYAPTSVPHLASVDTALTAMESQIDAIRHRLYEKQRAIPKAKKLIEQSEKQQKKLEHMLAHVPLGMQESLEI